MSRLHNILEFALCIVDTLAAFFDGDDINNAVQGGQFMRRLRPHRFPANRPSSSLLTRSRMPAGKRLSHMVPAPFSTRSMGT